MTGSLEGGNTASSDFKKPRLDGETDGHSSGIPDNGDQVYSTDLSLQEFGRWITSHGGYIDPSLILHKDDKSGDISVRLKEDWNPPMVDYKVPKKLVSIPTSLAFSLRSPPSQLPEKFESSKDVTSHSKLCFRISSHILLGSESSFYQYFRQLPKCFGTPLELNEEELGILEGTNAYAEVSARKERWEKEWKTGLELLRDHDGLDSNNYTWELFLKSALIISSRSFPSKLLDDLEEGRQLYPVTMSEAMDQSTPILIPLWDFLNHKITPVTWMHNRDQLELYSNSDISTWRPGDEVFNNYGPKGNEELLLSYGFCLEDSPSDYVSMKFKVPPLSESKHELRTLLPSTKDWPVGDVFYLKRVISPTPEICFTLEQIWPEALLDIFRLLVANSTEEDTWKTILVRGGGGKPIFPTRLELAVALQLRRATQAKLDPIMKVKNATSDSEAANRSRGANAAIVYRDGQIAILQSLLDHLDVFLSAFDVENRMTLARIFRADDKFGEAIRSHYEKKITELSSEEQDESLVAAIAVRYCQLLSDKSAMTHKHPWWAEWFDKMHRIYPFPFHEDRIKNIRGTEHGGMADGEEECDEAGAHVYENIFCPLGEEVPDYFLPEWELSPALATWGYELLGICGIEIKGETIITL